MSSTAPTARRAQAFNWDRIVRRIAEWQNRSRSRHELQNLSDATLRDIGVTRCDVQREAHKHFWMA